MSSKQPKTLNETVTSSFAVSDNSDANLEALG